MATKPVHSGQSNIQGSQTSTFSSMTRSLIQQFYPDRRVKPISQGDVGEMGLTLLDHTESIFHKFKGLHALYSNATENPMRFGCSVFTLGVGLAQMTAGDLILGGAATVLGAKEIYNQYTSRYDSTLAQLLNDVNADVDMITTLEEGQKQSLNVVEGNLEYIRGDVDHLYKKLDEIKALNLNAITSLEKDRQKAYAKGVAAKEAYREALQNFAAVKNSFSLSKGHYEKTAQFFLRIQQLVKDEDIEMPLPEKIDALLDQARQAAAVCALGKKELDAADEAFNKAMAALVHASSLKDKALEEITQIAQKAEDALKAGLEKVKYIKGCKDKISQAQAEVQEMKQRGDDVMLLLKEMSSDLKKAKAEAQKKWDNSDLVVGAGAGIIAAPLGAFSALAIGVTAAYAWHNGSTIADTTKKVYNYFFGTPLPLPKRMERDEYLQVKMDDQSSGYYSWIRGRPSFTFGYVDIKLCEHEYLQYRFDLNRPEYPISKEDLFTLYNRMFERLKDGSMTPAQCQSVLTQLEEITLHRGELRASVQGLIKSNQAAYGLVNALRRYCEKLSAVPT